MHLGLCMQPGAEEEANGRDPIWKLTLKVQCVSTMTMVSRCHKIKYVHTHSQTHTCFKPIICPLRYPKKLCWLPESSILWRHTWPVCTAYSWTVFLTEKNPINLRGKGLTPLSDPIRNCSNCLSIATMFWRLQVIYYGNWLKGMTTTLPLSPWKPRPAWLTDQTQQIRMRTQKIKLAITAQGNT